jgi:hypothetical protein
VRSSAHIDRPIRSQVVLAILVGLVLLAIPLYLLRSPDAQEESPTEQVPAGFAPSVPAGVEKEVKDERFSLEDPVKVKCSSSPAVAGKSGRLCDGLPFFEESLKKAIKESVDCAPRTGEKGSLNYVLKVDFNKRQLHVFPGASGMWKGPQARRATECVKRALPAPEWETLPHQYRYYEVAILANYAPPAPTEAPLFE